MAKKKGYSSQPFGDDSFIPPPEMLRGEMPAMPLPGSEITTRAKQMILAEGLLRICEALYLWEPMKWQDDFCRCTAHTVVSCGGNRCLGADTEIYDPVANVTRKVSEIGGDFHVLSRNVSGDVVVAAAEKPFIKGRGSLHLYELSNGCSFTATPEHRSLSEWGEWVPMRKASHWIPLLSMDNGGSVSVEEDLIVGDGDIWDFTVPVHHNYIHAGVASHNSGKTQCVACDVTRAMLGIDPYHKWPKKNGRVAIVAKNEKLIRDVVFDKLLRPGSFKLIRDEHTKLWRAFRPWQEYDKAYIEKQIDAPPLIPERLCHRKKDIIWESRDVPSKIFIPSTGWEASVYSGEGHPKPGMPLDLAWGDEEMENEMWMPELGMRTSTKKGKVRISATPEQGSAWLVDLKKRYDAGDPRVVFFQPNSFSNLYEDREALEASLEAYKVNPEFYKVKTSGAFLALSGRVFGEFDMDTFGCKQFPIPKHWTRYLSFDPGANPGTVVFVAVPPPKEDVEVTLLFKDSGRPITKVVRGVTFVIDEFTENDCSAEKFAQALISKGVKDNIHERFYIDMQYGQRAEAGTGIKTIEHYKDALRRHGIQSARQGCDFTAGYTGPGAAEIRVNAVKDWLRDGKVLVFEGKCPYLEDNFRRCQWGRDSKTGLATNKIVKRTGNSWDSLDCFSEDTEVLTDGGWKLFPHLHGDEKVATMNMGNNQLEYQKPTGYIQSDYSGEMTSFGGLKMSALVTPGHNMICCREGGERPFFWPAGQMNKRLRIKETAEWTGIDYATVALPASKMKPAITVDAGDMAEFMGWYVAEGSCHHNPKSKAKTKPYKVIISQTEAGKWTRLMELVKKLPWKPYIIRSRGKIQGVGYSSKALYSLVVGLGNKYTKRAPEWIKWSSRRLIDRFLESAILGDGWIQRIPSKAKGSTGVSESATYSTVSKQLADDIQELFFKAGYSSRIYIRPAKPYCIEGRHGTNTKDLYCVARRLSQFAYLCDHDKVPNFGPVQYTGKVYCVTTPNGTLVTRRNGVTLLAGNCLSYLSHAQPPWVPPVTSMQMSVKAFMDKEFEKMLRGGSSGGGLSIGPNIGT